MMRMHPGTVPIYDLDGGVFFVVSGDTLFSVLAMFYILTVF